MSVLPKTKEHRDYQTLAVAPLLFPTCSWSIHMAARVQLLTLNSNHSIDKEICLRTATFRNLRKPNADSLRAGHRDGRINALSAPPPTPFCEATPPRSQPEFSPICDYLIAFFGDSPHRTTDLSYVNYKRNKFEELGPEWLNVENWMQVIAPAFAEDYHARTAERLPSL